ncbi:hypothetical protein KC968_00535 [Candidatus Saccharibacteria bacterium]|nr:hypothetical protein [Candidatus Saccharibacteria bacterium]
MINEKFVLVGAVLNILGSATYALNTVKGKTKPNRVTWFLWAMAPLIAVSAQWSEGVTWAALMTFMVGFGPLVIFLSSFVNRQAYWKITKLDIFCGAISLLALILWFVTGQGLVALVFSILSDLVAGIPTLVKAFNEPETEHHSVFRNGAISAFITILTIQEWSFVNYGFALYILLICLTLYVLIRFKVGKNYFKIDNAKDVV